MVFELQSLCAGDLTGREQLTVKVEYDQNKTFVYSVEVQTHCVLVNFTFFLLLFLLLFVLFALHIMLLFCRDLFS